MSDQFDPDDIAEIEAALKKVEIEETSVVCSYSEMTYESARNMIRTADIYENGEELVDRWHAATELIQFALTYIASIKEMIGDEPTG